MRFVSRARGVGSVEEAMVVCVLRYSLSLLDQRSQADYCSYDFRFYRRLKAQDSKREIAPGSA